MTGDMGTQTETAMTVAVENIKEIDRSGRTEFVVLTDTIVAPMTDEEAQTIIEANIDQSTDPYKLRVIKNLITANHFFLKKGWHIGFRSAKIDKRYFLHLIVGSVDAKGRLKGKVYQISYLPPSQAVGVANVIRHWLSRSVPVIQ